MTPDRTVIHLLRHGEVHNPRGVLYGRLPGYLLSELGEAMAQRVAEAIGNRDITLVTASPLERAQRTAAPLAAVRGLPVGTDVRLIEAGNVFEGKTFGVGDGSLGRPSQWWHLRNPIRPSWGEPYRTLATRMLAAIAYARDAARGHEAVLVSHQAPIWLARSALEGRRLWHDPRTRECTLASLTTIVCAGDDVIDVQYSEPARDLLPVKLRGTPAAGA